MDLLKQAIDKIKAGDKDSARLLLADILKSNPQNEAAWMALSLVLDDPVKVCDCLERVLTLNPGNQVARERLDKLNESLVPYAATPSVLDKVAVPVTAREIHGDMLSSFDEPAHSEESLLSEDKPFSVRAKKKINFTRYISNIWEKLHLITSTISRLPKWGLIGVPIVIVVIIAGLVLSQGLFSTPEPTPVPVVAIVQSSTPIQIITSTPSQQATKPVTASTVTPRPTLTATETVTPVSTVYIRISQTAFPGGVATPFPLTPMKSSPEISWARFSILSQYSLDVCQAGVRLIRNAREMSEPAKISSLGAISAYLKEIGNVDLQEEIPPRGDEITASLSKTLDQGGDVIQKFFEGKYNTPEDAANLLEVYCNQITDRQKEILPYANLIGTSGDEINAAIQVFPQDDLDYFKPATAATPGQFRSNPVAINETLVTPGLEIKVLNVLREDDAWQALTKTLSTNPPPPSGMVYMLMKLRITANQNFEAERRINGTNFTVTGDRQISYFPASCTAGMPWDKDHPRCVVIASHVALDSAPPPGWNYEANFLSVKPPEPLDAIITVNKTVEGWLAFLVPEDEKNLMLHYTDFNSPEGNGYIALEDGAMFNIPEEIASLKPNLFGISRGKPATPDQSVITKEWEISIIENIRGEDALTFLKAFTPDVPEPAADMEYLVASLSARSVGKNDIPQEISPESFRIITANGEIIDPPVLSLPQPDLSAWLYPGGKAEGLVVFLLPKSETHALILFQAWGPLSEKSVRYLALN